FSVCVALVTVLSAVGICERCRVESGGVYFLLSHVLGSRFGGSIGLLYCFGQAVGCALNVLGFGESMAGLVNLEADPWVQRGFACAAVIFLSVINVAGVKWVIKLQFILLLILLLAGVDFVVGSFTHVEPDAGFEGWLSGNLRNNTFSAYEKGCSWFTVFGVFFPTVTGVLAGINMSGDLRHPSKDIPNGTLAALGAGTILYLLFSLFLAATCTRSMLLNDFMIASTVSEFKVLLLAGLYVSSFSSCLGAMYGTPRVLQSIAGQNVIPGMSCLSRGVPDKKRILEARNSLTKFEFKIFKRVLGAPVMGVDEDNKSSILDALKEIRDKLHAKPDKRTCPLITTKDTIKQIIHKVTEEAKGEIIRLSSELDGKLAEYRSSDREKWTFLEDVLKHIEKSQANSLTNSEDIKSLIHE
ncbi:solute carrier family 12 member 8-like, partial [Diachasma alloeum]|uniref:solute carrier family 12 member 8-like n=1 Tax=Diachasma alloeum TaxID=454923 RepID=UPI0007384733